MYAFPRILNWPRGAERATLRHWPRLVRGVAWSVTLVMIAWILANWFWQLAAPAPVPVAVPAPAPDYPTAARAIASRHLFGKNSPGEEVRSATPQFRLLGAMTASAGRPGFAILAEEGKAPVAAVEGEMFRPGATLLAVGAGSARVKIEDRIESIEMTEVKAAASSPAALRQPGGVPGMETGRR